jgi:predicted ATPase
MSSDAVLSGSTGRFITRTTWSNPTRRCIYVPTIAGRAALCARDRALAHSATTTAVLNLVDWATVGNTKVEVMRRRSSETRDHKAAQFATLLADTLHDLRVTHQGLANALGVTRYTVDSWTRIASPAVPAGENLDKLCFWLEQRSPGAGKRVAAMLSDVSPAAQNGAAAQLNRAGLSVMTTRLIGRDDAVNQIREAFDDSRLITLTGVGGIGKTRVALQVAGDSVLDYPDGAHVVELAPLSAPELLPSAVAAVLGVAPSPGKSMQDVLLAWLAPKQLLLVLDNCEHMLDAVRAFARALLFAGTQLRVLTTSREALHLPGELVVRIAPLGLPSSDQRASVARAPAAHLFVERALFATRGFSLSEDNAGQVAAICRRLDGIPLAIELAASALSTMDLPALAVRLDDRFKLLGNGAPSATPRHQTLRATIDWSYNLLAPELKRWLGQLAVLRGSWTLEAAQAVSGLVESTAEQLGALVNKSLITRQSADLSEAPRYAMLETIRDYALEKLAAEAQVQRDALANHAAYFLSVAEQAEESLRSAVQQAWLERLDGDLDNIRAALAWCAANQPVDGLRIVGALWQFWRIRNHLAEARDWAERMLALAPDVPVAETVRARTRALITAATMAYYQSDHATSSAHLRAAQGLAARADDREALAMIAARLARIDMYRDRHIDALNYSQQSLAFAQLAEDAWLIGYAWLTLGESHLRAGRAADQQAAYQQALTLMRETGDRWGQALALNGLAGALLDSEQYADAQALYEQSLAIQRELGDQGEVSKVLTNIGECLRGQGEFERAEALYRDALKIRFDIGAVFGTRMIRHNLARALIGKGDCDGAHALLQELLAGINSVEDAHSVSTYLIAIGTAWLCQGRDTRTALRLLAAADRAITGVSAGLDQPDKSAFARTLSALHAQLPDFDTVWAEGQDIALADALAMARGG